LLARLFSEGKTDTIESIWEVVPQPGLEPGLCSCTEEQPARSTIPGTRPVERRAFMNLINAGERLTLARGEHFAGEVFPRTKRTKLTFLGIDELVENLSAIFTRAGTRMIQTVVPDGTVRCAVDREEMDKAFVMLVGLVDGDAVVSILGGFVPIKAGEENDRKGCALLSISVREHSAEPDPSGNALTILRAVIRKHRGSFRLSRRGDEMRFSLYLPAVHDLKTEGSGIDG
jgi:hypothetical protein